MTPKVGVIDVGTDFSPYLGPRYRKLGPHSGEEFREDVLDPAFLANEVVVVRLDAIKGYSASFLEEAFGGLVRKHGLARVDSKLRFDTVTFAYLVPTIKAWMREADEDYDQAAAK